MQVTAKLNNLKISAKKVRLVAALVRELPAERALDQIKFIGKLSARPIAKLIKSAVANAEHNFDLDKSNLFIKEIKVDEGKPLKRWIPKAHGRATVLKKHSCHITLILEEIKDSGVKQAKTVKLEAPVKLGSKPKEDEGVKVGKGCKGPWHVAARQSARGCLEAGRTNAP